MSAAAAAPAPEGAAPPAPKGKKKLIIILAVVLLVLAAGGGGAVFYMKKKAAEAAAAAEAEGDGDEVAADTHKPAKAAKHDASHAPTFLPLEPFVVNLADKEADRYAQIGITLEIEDAKFADQLKAYMPAIRNGILMVLAHKTSQQLLERAGKEALAAEIMRESVRPLGIDVGDDDADEPPAKAAKDADEGDAKPKKKKKKKATEPNPVKHVHFSNFIIQ
jgi:flagellar FliL protein